MGPKHTKNISEQHVQRALALKRSDRTFILVAHRLTTLLDADRILVFDNGKIVETGTYPELMQSQGVFAELVRSATESAVPTEAA
jgi:ATP-binding cassette subfamily B protein